MAISIRQQIVTGLLVRLRTILVSNGYETNLGSNIFEWKTTDFQPSEMPGAAVRDVPEGPPVVRGDIHMHVLGFSVEIKVSDADPATVLRAAVADVEKAVGLSPKFSTFLVLNPVSNPDFDVEQNDSKLGSATVEFSVVYQTPAFAPFG